MIEVRRVKDSEYGLLPDSEGIHPGNSIVVAAFDNGKVVGKLSILMLPHIEGAWIDPEHRNMTIGARMEKEAMSTIESHGAKKAMAIAINKKYEDYLDRLGYSYLGTLWTKEI